MKKKNVFSLLLLFFVNALSAQHLSVDNKKKILASLHDGKIDTTQANQLLSLAIDYVLKPGESKQDMDSALLLLDKAASINQQLNYKKGRVRWLLYSSNAFREMGERKKGITHLDEALVFGERHKLYDLLGEIHIEHTQYAEDMGFASDQDKAEFMIRSYRKALECFRLAGDVERQGFVYKNLADLVGYYQRDYIQSIRYCYEALNLYRSINYPLLQGTYDLLGQNYTMIGDYPSAAKYGLLAVKTVESQKDSSLQLCTMYNRLGLTYYFAEVNYDTALYWMKKSYAVAERHKHIPSIALVGGNVARCYLHLGKYDDGIMTLDGMVKDFPQLMKDQRAALNTQATYLQLYLAKKDFFNAKKYYDYFAVFNDWDLRNHGLPSCIDYLIATRQLSAAERLIKIYDSPRFKIEWGYQGQYRARMQRYKLDSAKGNYKSAFIKLQHFKSIQDSAINQNTIKIIEALRIEREVEKKDEDIKAKAESIRLLKGEAQLQTQLTKQAKIIRNGTLAGISVLAIILLLVYNQYRIKRESSDQLLIQKNLIIEKNIALAALVNEKEWLLKEIHHRVKNNLQTIVSLLESQSGYLQNTEALSAITDSQNRVNAMSIIHQKLFQTQNLTDICVQSYIPELVDSLRNSLGTKHILFRTHIESLDLDVTQAIPIGLIINEAVTNAIKYAFPVVEDGQRIDVNLVVGDNKFVTLSISDNGTGLPQNFDINSNQCGLGLKLMKGLTGDIEGQFDIHSENGLTIQVTFTAIVPMGTTTDNSFVA